MFIHFVVLTAGTFDLYSTLFVSAVGVDHSQCLWRTAT